MSTARDRLLAGAATLTRSRGVGGTTVAELLAEAGVARRSLYLNFPGGRDEVIAAATEQTGSEMTEALQQLFAEVPDILSAMDAYLAITTADLVASDYTAGCPIVAAALGGTEVPLAREAAGRIFEQWQSLLSAALEVSGVATERAAGLAALILSSAEGATAMAIAQRSTEPLDRVGVMLRQLVADALPG
ncbi:TetR/AcrR family transcriptional regulator [Nocardioides ultimimeridianus]